MDYGNVFETIQFSLLEFVLNNDVLIVILSYYRGI